MSVFSFQTTLNIARGVIFKDRPFYVQYYILSRCNLNCHQCNIVEANSDLVDASLETVEMIADNLKRIGAGVVLLTGGEPFLRKDLPDIVRILRSRGLDPRLQTAGFSTTRDQLIACREAGASDINISLDSLVAEKQDYINGSISGSWLRAVETIVNAGEIFDSPKRICAFGTVISRMNHMEVPAIVEFAEFMGWYSSIVPVHITTPQNPMNFRGVDNGMSFDFPRDDQVLSDLHKKLVGMKHSGYPIFDSEAYLDSAFYFLRHNRPNWRNDGKCDSPSLYFAILPNGDFAVCCDHRYPGRVSVADPNFPQIYRSRQFREGVDPIVTSCGGCNYGSYPEVTLSVRDRRALAERALTVFRPARNRKHPRRSLEDALTYVEDLRRRHRIPDWDGPAFTVKPGAFSQRYGQPEQVFRGPRKVPKRYLPIVD